MKQGNEKIMDTIESLLIDNIDGLLTKGNKIEKDLRILNHDIEYFKMNISKENERVASNGFSSIPSDIEDSISIYLDRLNVISAEIDELQDELIEGNEKIEMVFELIKANYGKTNLVGQRTKLGALAYALQSCIHNITEYLQECEKNINDIINLLKDPKYVVRTKSVKMSDNINKMKEQQNKIIKFLNDILWQAMAERESNNYERLYVEMKKRTLIDMEKT